MSLVLYGVHLLKPITRIQARLSLALATLTLLLVTLPGAQLDTAWFVGLLTLGNLGAVGPLRNWDQHRALDVGRRVRIDEKSSVCQLMRQIVSNSTEYFFHI